MGLGNIRADWRHLAGMRRARALAVAATGAAAIATVIGLAIPAGASPVTARPGTVSGTEHFQDVSTSTTATTTPVIAWGPFTASGVDHTTGSTSDVFVFSGGSFKVIHTVKSASQALNAKTCFGQVTEKGTLKISGGTGKYKGISGSGTFTASVIFIEPKTKSGACNESANPVAQQIIISASGPVSLP